VTSEKFYTFIIMDIHGEYLLFFSCCNIISLIILEISCRLILLCTSYLVGTLLLLIFFYICLFGECGVWQTFCVTEFWFLAFLFGLYNYMYVVFL